MKRKADWSWYQWFHWTQWEIGFDWDRMLSGWWMLRVLLGPVGLALEHDSHDWGHHEVS